MNFKQNVFTKNQECFETINGITFRFVNKKSLYLGTEIIFYSGSNAEVYYDENNEIKYDKYGLAHFVEHLLFTKIKANKNMLQLLSSEKLSFNGATGQNATFYHAHELKEKFLNKSLKQLQEIAFTLDTDEEVISKEHGVVGTESTLSSDSPYTLMINKRAKYLNTCSMDHVVIGDVKSIESITLQDAINFYQDVYSLDNCEVVVYGSFIDEPDLKDRYVNQFMNNLAQLQKEYEITVSKIGKKRRTVFPSNVNYPCVKEKIVTPKIQTPTFYRTYFVPNSEVQCTTNHINAKMNIEFAFKLLNPQISQKLKDIYVENEIDYSKLSIDSSPYKEQNQGIEFSISYVDDDETKLTNAIELIENIFKNIENIITKEDFQTYMAYLEMTDNKVIDKTLSELIRVTAQSILDYSNLYSPQEMFNMTKSQKEAILNYEEFATFIKNVNLDKNYLQFEFTNVEN